MFIYISKGPSIAGSSFTLVIYQICSKHYSQLFSLGVPLECVLPHNYTPGHEGKATSWDKASILSQLESHTVKCNWIAMSKFQDGRPAIFSVKWGERTQMQRQRHDTWKFTTLWASCYRLFHSWFSPLFITVNQVFSTIVNQALLAMCQVRRG